KSQREPQRRQDSKGAQRRTTRGHALVKIKRVARTKRATKTQRRKGGTKKNKKGTCARKDAKTRRGHEEKIDSSTHPLTPSPRHPLIQSPTLPLSPSPTLPPQRRHDWPTGQSER